MSSTSDTEVGPEIGKIIMGNSHYCNQTKWNKYELKMSEMSCKYFMLKDHYWASEASPTLGCSIEISRDIYMYVCM